jgi:hypothetical protein
MKPAQSCSTCGASFDAGPRLVLVRGWANEEHCSETCLRVTLRNRQIASVAAKRRWLLRVLCAAVLMGAAGSLWTRHRMPQPQSISFESPEAPPEPPAPGPIEFGPNWPPTDADWTLAFNNASWIYPLPGPIRRPPTVDGRTFAHQPPGRHAAYCRTQGQCGVDLGGQLWGEHVYAVADGVVDRVRRAADDDPAGESVRLAHFGGFVFTQYVHLAGIPRAIVAGVRIKAGDVIGLVGDTGNERQARHLYFSLSVHPARDLPEVYWDPTPWMAHWPLRLPLHGTVAGFAPERDAELPRRRPRE